MADQDSILVTEQQGWRVSLDGATETRTTFGTSARGFHFAIETSHLGADPGTAGWSRPYATPDEAAKVAGIRADMALGEREASPREEVRDRQRSIALDHGPAPGAAVARALDDAARRRYMAVNMSGGAEYVAKAKDSVEEARGLNQPSPEARAAAYWERVRQAGLEQAQANGLSAAAAVKREEAQEDRQAAARVRGPRI